MHIQSGGFIVAIECGVLPGSAVVPAFAGLSPLGAGKRNRDCDAAVTQPTVAGGRSKPGIGQLKLRFFSHDC